MKTKTEKLILGEDYYLNKNGLMVFTEKFHKDRGSCCGSNCLHCPYKGKEKKKSPQVENN